MDSFIVQADAAGARELVPHAGSRAGSVFFHYPRANFIQILRRNARLDLSFHRIQYLTHNATNRFQVDQLLLILNAHFPAPLSE